MPHMKKMIHHFKKAHEHMMKHDGAEPKSESKIEHASKKHKAKKVVHKKGRPAKKHSKHHEMM